jgi:hypothetical protein
MDCAGSAIPLHLDAHYTVWFTRASDLNTLAKASYCGPEAMARSKRWSDGF